MNTCVPFGAIKQLEMTAFENCAHFNRDQLKLHRFMAIHLPSLKLSVGQKVPHAGNDFLQMCLEGKMAGG